MGLIIFIKFVRLLVHELLIVASLLLYFIPENTRFIEDAKFMEMKFSSLFFTHSTTERILYIQLNLLYILDTLIFMV